MKKILDQINLTVSQTQDAPVLPQETIAEETTHQETVSEETAAVELNSEYSQLFQNDYPNVRYGAGSVASDGCGIVSLAIIAEKLTGHRYNVVDLARWFGGRAENNIQRMEIGATTLGLPWEKAENFDKATQALSEGKLIILMMDGFHFANPFTTSQHFVVVYGVTPDNRYLIHDPNKQNYDKWQLKAGFEKGFTRDTLIAGYSGSWIFDPDAVAEDYVPYVKNEPPRQDNYPGLELTFQEQEMLAKLIWAEARGECAEGQQAVAEVVFNRLVSGKFAKTLAGIIVPSQFHGCEKMDEAEPWQAQYDAIDAARYSVPVLAKDVYYFATSPMTSRVYTTIGGHVFCQEELEEIKLGVAEPKPTEPVATEPVATEPAATEPVVTEPVVTEPVVTEPVVTEPVVTEPVVTEPVVTEPVVTEPVVTEPVVTEPVVTEPVATEPAVLELKPANKEPVPQDTKDEAHDIPVFYQSDYPDIAYGDGTIEDNASGIVTLAMVSNYLTGHPYTPDMLAGWFPVSGEDDVSYVDDVIAALKLPCEHTEEMEEASDAVQENKLLILRLESSEEAASIFTDDVQFVVVYGMAGDGKFLVSDPNQDSAEKEALVDGFENGFDQEDVLSACTNAWIFDPDAIDDDFTPYKQ